MEKSKTAVHLISCFIIVFPIFGILSATVLAKNGNGTGNGTRMEQVTEQVTISKIKNRLKLFRKRILTRKKPRIIAGTRM